MAARVVRWFISSEVGETKSRNSSNKFSLLKKKNDEREAGESGDHEIMNISYTPTNSSTIATFREGIDRITKLLLYTYTCCLGFNLTFLGMALID